MSYEGYEKKWCMNGHSWTHNVYQSGDVDHCPVCGMPYMSFTCVDETNGTPEEEPSFLKLPKMVERVKQETYNPLATSSWNKWTAKVFDRVIFEYIPIPDGEKDKNKFSKNVFLRNEG